MTTPSIFWRLALHAATKLERQLSHTMQHLGGRRDEQAHKRRRWWLSRRSSEEIHRRPLDCSKRCFDAQHTQKLHGKLAAYQPGALIVRYLHEVRGNLQDAAIGSSRATGSAILRWASFPAGQAFAETPCGGCWNADCHMRVSMGALECVTRLGKGGRNMP